LGTILLLGEYEKKLQIDALDLIAGDNSMHVQGQADKNTNKSVLDKFLNVK
jgi:hypothetical protein